MTTHAIYQNGSLTLLDPLDLPEGVKVRIDVYLESDTSALAPKTISADRLSALVGITALGGDALEDSEALYDADWD